MSHLGHRQPSRGPVCLSGRWCVHLEQSINWLNSEGPSSSPSSSLIYPVLPCPALTPPPPPPCRWCVGSCSHPPLGPGSRSAWSLLHHRTGRHGLGSVGGTHTPTHPHKSSSSSTGQQQGTQTQPTNSSSSRNRTAAAEGGWHQPAATAASQYIGAAGCVVLQPCGDGLLLLHPTGEGGGGAKASCQDTFQPVVCG